MMKLRRLRSLFFATKLILSHTITVLNNSTIHIQIIQLYTIDIYNKAVILYIFYLQAL